MLNISNDTNVVYSLPYWLSYPVIILLSTFMILTFVLNILSITCIINARAFTPINLLLMNLSVSDIIYTANIPMFAAQFISSFSYSQNVCRVLILFDVQSLMVNVHTISALTLERYFCLRDSKKSYNEKFKTLIIIFYIILLWSVSLAFSLPRIFSIVKTPDGDCSSVWSNQKTMVYYSVKFILFFALPYAIIIMFSINILLFLKEWAKNAKKLTNYNKNGSKKKCSNETSSLQSHTTTLQPVYTTLLTRTSTIKNRTTCFVLAVVISYVITWSPLWAFQIYDAFSSTYTPYIMIINSVVLVINYSSGVINPLLFMLLTQNFREYFQKLVADVRKVIRRSSVNRELKHRSSTKHLLELKSKNNNNNNNSNGNHLNTPPRGSNNKSVKFELSTSDLSNNCDKHIRTASNNGCMTMYVNNIQDDKAIHFV